MLNISVELVGVNGRFELVFDCGECCSLLDVCCCANIACGGGAGKTTDGGNADQYGG